MWRFRLQQIVDRRGTVVSTAGMAFILLLAWLIGAQGRADAISYGLTSDASFSTLKPAAASPAVAQIPPQTFEPLAPADAQLLNAKLPFSDLPNPSAKPFILHAVSPNDAATAQTCLTMAVYYEAASQSIDGQAAVAQVVLNRLRNPRFPKTVCGVVFQGSSQATGCQFTFTCDGSLGRVPGAAGWKRAEAVAVRALGGYVQTSVGEATHYHTMWVVPYWQSTMVKITQIEAHIFYRWDGRIGMPEAFQGQYAGAEILPIAVAGLHTGLETPVVDKVELPASQPAVDVAAPPIVETITPAAAPTQVAMLTAPSFPTLPAAVAPPEKPKTFFGGGRNSNQRLAMPSRW